LYGEAGLCAAASFGVARQDSRSRGAPPGRVLLPAVRCVAVAAPGSATRSVSREWQAQRDEIATRDTVHRSGPGSAHRRVPPDATPLRTKRQLWTYIGFGIETHSSAEHNYVEGQLQRSKRQISVRGLNRNHHHDLKNLFKSAATIAAAKSGPF
jgi:hypothetical protein